MPQDIQQRFLQAIHDLVPESQAVVDVLADVLEMSNDSVYRRLRGETRLSIHEIEAICNHFKLSFDSLLNTDQRSVTFNYSQLRSLDDFYGYFGSMKQHMQMLAAKPGAIIKYAAQDIPLFHHFEHNLLAAFKIFYWLRAVFNYEPFTQIKFSNQTVPAELMDMCKNVNDVYRNINTIEIWSDDTVNSTLKQIHFYWESGIFQDKETALQVCNEFRKEMEEVQAYAENASHMVQNKMTRDNNYMLYISDIDIGTNCIFTGVGEFKGIHLSFNTLNKLLTTNNAFAEQADNWIENLIKRSTLVSGTSEKHRYQFFRRINSKVDKLEAGIKEG